MTDTMIDLPGVIAKSDDSDFVRELIQDAAQRLMAIDVGAVCGAVHGEHSPDRENLRNGYRPRQWDTDAGPIGLNIPKLRPGRRADRPAHGDRMIRQQTDHGQPFPYVSGATPDSREGARRSDTGGLHPRDLDLRRRRAGACPSRACWPCPFEGSDERPPGLSWD